MATDWVAAVRKIKGYVDTYLAIPNPTAKQKAALRTDLATLDHDLDELAKSQAAEPAAITDPEVIWAKFLDALHAKQAADGFEVGGGDGAGATSGHSYTRDETIAIVNGLGIPNALEILAERGYSFGPEPPPGTIA